MFASLSYLTVDIIIFRSIVQIAIATILADIEQDRKALIEHQITLFPQLFFTSSVLENSCVALCNVLYSSKSNFTVVCK